MWNMCSVVCLCVEVLCMNCGGDVMELGCRLKVNFVFISHSVV